MFHTNTCMFFIKTDRFCHLFKLICREILIFGRQSTGFHKGRVLICNINTPLNRAVGDTSVQRNADFHQLETGDVGNPTQEIARKVVRMISTNNNLVNRKLEDMLSGKFPPIPVRWRGNSETKANKCSTNNNKVGKPQYLLVSANCC